MVRRRTLVSLLVAMGTLLVVGSVSAEWAVELFVGGAFTDSHSVKRGTTKLADVDFDTSGLVGGRIGYWLDDSDYWGLAFDVVHYRPDISPQTLRSPALRLASTDISVIAGSLDLTLRYPLFTSPEFPKGRLQPYAL